MAGSRTGGVRHCDVAFDISLGETRPPDIIPQSFAEFHASYGETIARVLHLACGDTSVADEATLIALTRASQRWKQLHGHGNPVGWVIGAGLQSADKTLRENPPTTVNQGTGGYVRGLELGDAVHALPMYQRAAVVTSHHLGWSDDFTASGFEVPTSMVATRRERAVSFVAHHLRLTNTEVAPLLRDHLRQLDGRLSPVVPEAASVRVRGRRRTARNRLGALALAVAVILVGAALLRPSSQEIAIDVPEPVDGPRTSRSWFDPVSDGRGDFVALNTSGSAKFVESSDGVEWFEAASWNSRAVDLRTEVTGFLRTGDRYVAFIEQHDAISEFLAPRIATSRNLRDWTVRQLDIEAPLAVEGLQRGYQVVASAASGDLVLVAVEATEQFDHRSFEIRAEDVCGERVTATDREYFLCDSDAIIEVSRGEQRVSETNFYLAADGELFRSVALPPDSSSRSLVGFGGGFAVADSNQGQVWVSPDGIDWERATTASAPNRFVLLEGDERGALVIEPAASGWTSHVVAPSGIGASGDIPLAIDPSGVWSQPDIASGPAGWALFVTTSRPWERAGDVPGWAVATPSWIVSQLPDADTITAQSVPDGTILRVAVDGPWVTTESDGTIVLRDPINNGVVVEVTPEQIEQARPTALDDARVKAQVFFSADGVTWEAVWSSTNDAWSGSVAVGDDEILLSGTQLTGAPITISLDDS